MANVKQRPLTTEQMAAAVIFLRRCYFLQKRAGFIEF